MSHRTYLDYNATAPLCAEARDAMAAAFDCVGNPSSVHQEGRAARQIVEQARAEVAALVGAEPRHVVFTSGGTEANALALNPAIRRAERGPCGRLLISAAEHPAVGAGGSFARDAVLTLPLLASGVADLAALAALLAAPGQPVAMLSLMLANNETGVLQPVAEASAAVREAGGLTHTDAVQAAGKIAMDINSLGVDLLSVSAHKIGGPKGVGALIFADGVVVPPLLRGGGQERGMRAGTENVLGIAGFGAAAKAARRDLADEAARLTGLRRRLEDGLREIAPATVIFGAEAERLPNTVLFATPGIGAETALIALDLDGVAVSSGSACSSGKVTPSHVLAAMGVAPALARGAIRASFGTKSSEQDIERLLQAWRRRVEALPKGQQEIAA